MTSDVDALQTNEFLRRRKLRLQQVREQSKDIAKKIRQRAKLEKLRQVGELDTKKQQEYFKHQEKLIKKLEEYYAKGIENVGAGHKNAICVTTQEAQADKLDISKQRGKEAVAQLRKKRQEVLDYQKKKLDRKLQAREAANEISREKSASVANKVNSKPSATSIDKIQQTDSDKDGAQNQVTRNDMATQCEVDEVPNELEPNIPALALPKDDSAKECNSESKSDKSKRLDLFALSEEMPSSLRGTIVNEERVPIRPSLTLVSEYLQNRGLRLREFEPVSSKKTTNDFQSLRQTIIRTRTSREVSAKSSNDNPNKPTTASPHNRKSSVTIYNHSTRNTRDIPYNDDELVVRDKDNNEDAYAQAIKKTTESKINKDQKKLQEIRGKVAMTKQNVEKEYRDTISFLNSLPKDTEERPIRTAYMDEHRQQLQKDKHQKKMQQEYKNILRESKECKKHTCRNKTRTKSQSPIQDDEMDFQYSWLPVPEGDKNLAVHTIPTTVKGGKTNSVKFSKVDSYHEYRSRHKHTPPTKDTVQKSDSTTDSDITESESSEEEIRLERKKSKDADMSDADRIVIYKIMDSKNDRKTKKKLVKEIAKSLTMMEKPSSTENCTKKSVPQKSYDSDNRVSFEQIDEGVYETVTQNGDNMNSVYCRDNEGEKAPLRPSRCNRKVQNEQQREQGTTSPQCNCGSKHPSSLRLPKTAMVCKCGCQVPEATCKICNKHVHEAIIKEPVQQSKVVDNVEPTVAVSDTTDNSGGSLKTATSNKVNDVATNSGYIKLVDDGGREAGKVYIGAPTILNDNMYEVVIQLRKKDDNNDDKEIHFDKIPSAVESNKDDFVQAPKYSKETSKVITDVMDAATDISLTSNNGHNKNISKDILTESPKEVKRVAEVGVCTSQDTDVRPNEIPKPDSVQTRPATSTYTQTSMSSPNHRPVYYHMSSSTSTAYMSPPDMILPKFLRQDHQLTDEDIYDSNNYNVQENLFDNLKQDKYACQCKRCVKAKRISNSHKNYERPGNKEGDLQVPPNTATSREGDERFGIYINEEQNSATNIHKKKKHKCRRCENRHVTAKQSTQHVVKTTPSNATTKKERNLTTKISKSNLNPTVKLYINKLLSLNRQSLKAVEVMDQQCSPVTTPSSSIINEGTNKIITKPVDNKISLEQIKNMVKEQIVEEIQCHLQDRSHQNNHCSSTDERDLRVKINSNKNIKCNKISRKKSFHKVKSLNISKKLCKPKKSTISLQQQIKPAYSSSSTREEVKRLVHVPQKTKIRSKSSPTPRMNKIVDEENANLNTFKNMNENTNKHKIENYTKNCCKKVPSKVDYKTQRQFYSVSSTFPSNRLTSDSRDSSVNVENDFVKIAEDKIHNIEAIAELTEKCTKRLSNLAKVLNEVRKNKSLAYSHISSSDNASDSEQKLENNLNKLPQVEPFLHHEQPAESKSSELQTTIERKDDKNCTLNTTNYIPFLSDIPKPATFKNLNTSQLSTSSSNSSKKTSSPPPDVEHFGHSSKRGKPPPALLRIQVKHGHDLVVPHELSTVVEVDSPMSVKMKSHTSKNDTRPEMQDNTNYQKKDKKDGDGKALENELQNLVINNPDMVETKADLPNQATRLGDSSDDSKIQMIGLKQFNEIMLKPYFSIQEYAKQYNIETLDEGSNLDDNPPKEVVLNEELSSLQSDSSLPDVISELLKRNLITEPFKFDTGSNINSTTISSESTLPLLALTKTKKDKKKSSVMFQNKENIGETSDTLSISSNPDLENAFKKLGMGWASSTLKKTKERLALSSSSNTSSSSLRQFKMKNINPDVPALVTDTMSSVLNAPKRNQLENSKNAEQQTSLTNTMTVKEFLKNELSKKITFDKSRNDTEEEFISLFETKMPEEMKHSSRVVKEHSMENSLQSGTNRARTSTPVQLYKSMTYHSSSSSNLSNGLFSNVDDLSSVKHTSNSMKHSTSDKDDLTIPNFSLKIKKSSDCSKSD